ncbi:MAG: MupG family TIM beta-alpha barrel fold protein [Lactobacillus johnsonii]|nr:MupG family TIM beta-alpha barrel fold protein [Lactobacillus johnsonii]
MFRAVEGAEDDPKLGEKDLKDLKLNEKDIVIGLAASGRTPYVIGCLKYANQVKALTISIACVKKSEIGINASTFNEEELKELLLLNVKRENVQAWFNFYPSPDTGISQQFLEQQVRMFKKYGFTTQAFFSGDENLRGPLYEGLPTLEKQRYYSPLASILELQNMGVDLVYVGDGGISEDSLRQIDTYKNKKQILLHTKKCENGDKDLYDYVLGKHNQRPDPAEYVVRCEDSRLHPVPVIKKNNTGKRYIGDITINNDKYQRYMGEIQILKVNLPASEKVNIVGKIIEKDIPLINLIKPSQEFILLRTMKE